MLGLVSVEASQLSTYYGVSTLEWEWMETTTLVVDWDSDENLKDVRTRVALIKKGCGCKSGCLSGRCKSQKSDSRCGPGCTCQGCLNFDLSSDSDGSEDGNNGDDLQTEVDQLMYG